jgi:hypothetical protein
MYEGGVHPEMQFRAGERFTTHTIQTKNKLDIVYYPLDYLLSFP